MVVIVIDLSKLFKTVWKEKEGEGGKRTNTYWIQDTSQTWSCLLLIVVSRNKYQQFWLYHPTLMVSTGSCQPHLLQQHNVSLLITCPVPNPSTSLSPAHLISPSVTTSARMEPPKRSNYKCSHVRGFCPSGDPWSNATLTTIYDFAVIKAMQKGILISKSKEMKRPKVVSINAYNCANMLWTNRSWKRL